VATARGESAGRATGRFGQAARYNVSRRADLEKIMAIDKSGKWWIGSTPEDIGEYLDAFSEDSYPVHEFRLARCDCGSLEFRLDACDDEGVARRICARCKKEHFICDSEESWEEAEPEQWKCVECKSKTTNIGVGFALYDDRKNIHWLYVGQRCARCGVLGCFASWKIGYGPSLPLIDQV
jgi:hypothetical protein